MSAAELFRRGAKFDALGGHHGHLDVRAESGRFVARWRDQGGRILAVGTAPVFDAALWVLGEELDAAIRCESCGDREYGAEIGLCDECSAQQGAA